MSERFENRKFVFSFSPLKAQAMSYGEAERQRTDGVTAFKVLRGFSEILRDSLRFSERLSEVFRDFLRVRFLNGNGAEKC